MGMENTKKAPESVSSPTGDLKKVDSSSTDVANREAPAQLKKKEISNLQSLLKALYEGKFKRKVLTKKEVASIASSPMMGADERDCIVALIKADESLKLTTQALQLALLAENPLRVRLKTFLLNAIKLLPVFQMDIISSVFFDEPGTQIQENVICEILKIDFTAFYNNVNAKKVSSKNYITYSENVFQCILLILALNGVSAQNISNYIYKYVISKKAKHISDYERINAIIFAKEKQCISAQYEILKSELIRVQSCIESANKNIAIQKSDIFNLEQEIADLRNKLNLMNEENSELKNMIAENSVMHEGEKIELKKSIQQLSGRVLHSLIREVDLLDSGLFALQRTPPKVNVMVDHAERAISGLRAEIEELRKGS